MNISNRWTGLGWTTPTQSRQAGVISHGNGGPWLDVDQYDLDAWWVNSFTVNRTTDSHTTDFNLQLDYDRGGPFSFSLRGIHGDADYLSMNGQVQGDLSNWRPGGHTFTLFRNAADATRGTFYPAAIAALYQDRKRPRLNSSPSCAYRTPSPT